MNRIFLFLAFAVCSMVAASCSDDDDEFQLSASMLVQTTWKMESYATNRDNGVLRKVGDHIFEFTTDSTGKSIDLNDEGIGWRADFFDYSINGRMMYISSPYLDNWVIMEQSKDRFVLQAYRPELQQLVLTRMY